MVWVAGARERPQTASAGLGAARKRAFHFLTQATERPVAWARVGVVQSGCWSHRVSNRLRSAMIACLHEIAPAVRETPRRGWVGLCCASYTAYRRSPCQLADCWLR